MFEWDDGGGVAATKQTSRRQDFSLSSLLRRCTPFPPTILCY